MQNKLLVGRKKAIMLIIMFVVVVISGLFPLTACCVLVCMLWLEEGSNTLILLKQLQVLQVQIQLFESFLFVV